MQYSSRAIAFISFLSLLMGNIIIAQTDLSSIIDRYEKYEEEMGGNHSMSWHMLDNEILEKNLLEYQQLLNLLNSLDSEAFNSNDRINYDMLNYILANEVFLLQFEDHLMPLNSEGGFITSMIYECQNKKLNTENEVNNYLTKLSDTPRYLLQQQNFMQEGLNKNKSHCQLVVSNCVKILDDLLLEGESNFFAFKPLKANGTSLSSELSHDVYQSFVELKYFLEHSYLPNAKEEIGISNIENGNAYYEQRVRYNTSLNLSSEEVYNIGLAEVSRIKSEMLELIKQLGFEGSLEEFITNLRNDQSFIAQSDQELLYYASWLSKKAEEFLPRYFGHLPRLPFTVNPVPADIAPNYTTGRYSGGSWSAKRAGQYWVNTYNLTSRPMYMLPALTLHEAVPGHHLQISLAKEMKDLPGFRSYYLSAFGEGWGLYSEYLGKEAGYYSSLYEEFGRLSYEMWRACRLVIDPGIHVKSWSRDEAIQYMQEHTSLSFHEIETEINRYIGWPGQAVSYKIGELKIKELRALAERELGQEFDIREFHDTLLSNGSLPLETLERIIRNYINEKKNE